MLVLLASLPASHDQTMITLLFEKDGFRYTEVIAELFLNKSQRRV